jgi:hypothetical protein
MANNQNWTVRDGVFAAAAIAFMLFLHGALPFFMTPTLGQAIWTAGFSQSFANGPLYSIYAHDFGIPKPAAIAFGLAGAWPASVLIRLGLHPADAYSGMVALWLVVAFFSAYKIARKFGALRPMSLLGAMAWMSMPVIWGHAGYSMLSLGIGLLPLYFLAALKLLSVESGKNKISGSAIVLYFVVAVIAVFMDGYTFMMFAAGATILFAFTVITRPEIRPPLLRMALPVHLASLALAYVFFSAYIGKSNFEVHAIDFFRGWGLDLSFITIPTKGVHWLPDLLGISLERSNDAYFGDASVWTTTFSLPVILAGLFAWWKGKRQGTVATGILLVAAFGFYMALGPSLKINSTKQAHLQLAHPRGQSQTMPAEMAVMPTGNAWISEKLPGFNAMRASYRWSALGVFALWLLVIIYSAKAQKRNTLWPWILIFLIALNVPDPARWWKTGTDERAIFLKIDRELVSELRQKIRKGETVAFIPWDNDFVANYLAPRAGFRTFNIGGDKNLSEARKEWPSNMLALGREIDASKVHVVVNMLVDGTADVVLVPYLQKLWPSHLWPCLDITTPPPSNEQRRVTGFVCPAQWKTETQPIVRALSECLVLDVLDSNLFTTIRLRPKFAGSANRSALISALLGNIRYPIIFGAGLKDSAFVLSKGWHDLEPNIVWSQADSRLTLPVPKECAARQCFAVLRFNVFGASSQRPVTAHFRSVGSTGNWHEKVISTSGKGNEVAVPLSGANGSQDISISIPDATSPQALTGSPDGRVLGIALQRTDLVSEEKSRPIITPAVN